MTIEEFGTAISPFTVAIDFIVGTACILVILFVTFKFRKKYKQNVSLKTAVGEISLSDQKEVDAEESTTSQFPPKEPSTQLIPGHMSQAASSLLRNHADCQFAKDFIIVISKSIRFGAELNTIEDKYIIRDQMNSAQIKIEQIKSIMEKCYANVLYAKRGLEVNLMQDPSYLIFVHFVSEVGRSALMEIKGYFRENGLADLSDEDFEDYAREHSDKILNNFKMYLQMMLPTAVSPSRLEFEKEFNPEQTISYNLIKDAFYSAREVSIRWKKIIAQKEAEFDKEILALTGICEASKI